MKNKYLDMLSKEEFADLLKQLNFETYENICCFQGTKKLNMTDGHIGIFSYKYSEQKVLYLKDFKIKYSDKNKLPNELPVNRKRTEILFVYMMKKFEDYYDQAKYYWKDDPYLLRILETAHRRLELTRKTKSQAAKDVEDEGGASSI